MKRNSSHGLCNSPIVFRKEAIFRGLLSAHLIAIRFRRLRNSPCDSQLEFYFTTVTMRVRGRQLWSLYEYMVFGRGQPSDCDIVEIEPCSAELSELEAEEAAAMFSRDDLVDLAGLARKLKEKHRPIDRWLSANIAEQKLERLSGYGGEPIDDHGLSPILGALNGAIQGPLIFDESRFTGVDLSLETQAVLASDPKGVEAIRCNRMLLRDAYGKELKPYQSGRTPLDNNP